MRRRDDREGRGKDMEEISQDGKEIQGGEAEGDGGTVSAGA